MMKICPDKDSYRCTMCGEELSGARIAYKMHWEGETRRKAAERIHREDGCRTHQATAVGADGVKRTILITEEEFETLRKAGAELDDDE